MSGPGEQRLVITIAELHAGIHAATDTPTRARRARTLDRVSALEPLTVTLDAAQHWGALRALLAEAGRHARVNDLWIAAIAAANALPVLTQDADFDVIASVGGPLVLKV